MNIQVIGDNVDIDSRYKDIVDDVLGEKIDKLLVDFAEDMKHATVKISKIPSKSLFQLNFNMWLPGKEQIFADSEHEVFMSAVVNLREAVESQIKKYKGKLG